MDEILKKLQVAINTVQDLDIKSTLGNVTKLLGVIQLLSSVRDEMQKQDEKGGLT